ncbi:hypothetical protein RB653_001466 [Dictyostelium firmibasis]|uniref:Uncharacterized protein n=1 Tax=Dictyostelium firmibasis TaxID=79012 RepID=A0AAN7UGR1_9MYCE
MSQLFRAAQRSGIFKSSFRSTGLIQTTSIITRAGARPPIHFKDNKYDGEMEELFEVKPEFMSPDADHQLERDPLVHIKFFLKFFGILAGFGFACYMLTDPTRKQVLHFKQFKQFQQLVDKTERDLPFNNLYLEYGGDPNITPDEKKWRLQMGDRQAIYRAKYGLDK